MKKQVVENLGEEIIKKYKDVWFIDDNSYSQFENYYGHCFEISVLSWDMSFLSFDRVNAISRFSELDIIKDTELIEKLNKAKRREITKKSIKLGWPLITKK